MFNTEKRQAVITWHNIDVNKTAIELFKAIVWFDFAAYGPVVFHQRILLKQRRNQMDALGAWAPRAYKTDIAYLRVLNLQFQWLRTDFANKSTSFQNILATLLNASVPSEILEFWKCMNCSILPSFIQKYTLHGLHLNSSSMFEIL